jgi:hypothetical protein
MQVHLRNPLLAIATVMATVLLSSCALLGAETYHDTGVTDEQYVSIAGRTPEAELILTTYPQAEALVDRDGALAVDYRVSKHPPTSSAQRWEGIRVRVFIDPGSRQPNGILVQCDDKIIQKDTMPYLRRYVETRSCP